MNNDFQWKKILSFPVAKIVKIGGKIDPEEDTISFVGTLAGASISCGLAGPNHWNEPYFGLASVSTAESKGIWLFDKNKSSIPNYGQTASFGPSLMDGLTPPTWNDVNDKYTFYASQSKVMNLQNYLEYEDNAAMKGFTLIALVQMINSPSSGEEGSIIKMEGRRKIGLYINDSNNIILKYLKSDGTTWSSTDTGVSLSTSYMPILFGFQRNEMDPQNSVITYQISNSEEMSGFIVNGKCYLKYH